MIVVECMNCYLAFFLRRCVLRRGSSIPLTTMFCVGSVISAQSAEMAGRSAAAPQLPGWTLVWQDEFTESKLDPRKWSLCKRGKADWNNTMSDDARLLKISEGVLHLRGIQNKQKGKGASPYLTSGVNSKGKYEFQFGKVQIRAKFKSAQGAWPALWMLGAEKGWPANGEMDLMEHLNFDRKIYQTVHSEYTIKVDKTNTPQKGAVASIKRDDWNTYGCEWDADKVVFTVNEKPTHSYPRVPEKGAKQYPFTQPFYFVLSMQIGGKWVGKAKPEHYPAEMQVDWIRVYQKK